MKKMLLALALMVVVASASFASVDWVGNPWPISGSVIQDDQDLTVYLQVFKSEVTEGPGQGAGIEVYVTVPGSGQWYVDYNTDVGNNDEYMITIPFAYFQYTEVLELEFEVVDLTGGPVEYLMVHYLVNNTTVSDMHVTFSLCLDGIDYFGTPCITGSIAELGGWVEGIELTNMGGDVWTTTVLISSGSTNPVEYKYKRNNCSYWEDIPNRELLRPGGTSVLVLDMVSWENGPGSCGTVATEETNWGSLKSQYR